MLKEEFCWECRGFLTIVATIAIATLALGVHCVGELVGSSDSSTSLPNCPDKCGNVTIPYPFGVGDTCHYNHPDDGLFYNISCDSSKVPKYGSLELEKITLDGEFRVRNDFAYTCYAKNGIKTGCSCHHSWIRVSRFAISTTQNMIGAIGCDTYAVFSGTRMNSSRRFLTGCVTGCNNAEEAGTKCSGIGCCEVSMPKGVTNITIKVSSLNKHKDVQMFNPCSIAFVVAKDQGQSNKLLPFSIQSIIAKDVTYFDNHKNLINPIVYDWSVGTKNCETAKLDKQHYLCKGNSVCQDLPEQWGYRCQCKPGFRGNPYLHDCQDVDECAEEMHTSDKRCKEPAHCVNYVGGYNCTCPPGYSCGNGTENNPCIACDDKSDDLPKIIGGVGSGVIVCLVVAFYLHWQHGKRELKKLRDSFFHKNGGHILQQKVSRLDVSVGTTVEMFTIEELKKATNSFSPDSVIGKGGFGTVYKGNLARKVIPPKLQNNCNTLTKRYFVPLWSKCCNYFGAEDVTSMPDNKVIAIKKCLKVGSTQVAQFINEIIALSQINNKNVVKMIGCCLETEMPLLVYEYISNGTLSEHLHDERKASFLSWDIRLRIATEVSEVLAYLHTTISIPIIHRDIKSANILLDESYTAKVADFGASKLAPTDHRQLETMVQGTWGYLDPEYMQSGILTEKSDVYSFGVVLVELLTRKRVISHNRPEDDRCLAFYFLRKLNEDGLYDILDEKIVNSGGEIMKQQLRKVSQIAKKCLEVKGEDRPTMKEVARDLDEIKLELSSHPCLNSEGLGLKEDTENFLGERHVVYKDSSNEAIHDPLSKDTSAVQLMPTDEGR